MAEYETRMRSLLTEVLGKDNWHELSFNPGHKIGPLRLEELRTKINAALHASRQKKIELSHIVMTLVLRDLSKGEPEDIVIAAIPGGNRFDDYKVHCALPPGHDLQPYDLPKLDAVHAVEVMGSVPGLFSPFPLGASEEHRKKMTVLVDSRITQSDEYHFIPLNNTTQALVKGSDFRRVLEHMQKDSRGPFKCLIHDKEIA